MQAFELNGRRFFPLTELMSSLEVALNYGPAQRKIDGFFAEPGRRVDISLDTLRGNVGERSVQADPRDVIEDTGEIYMTLQAIEALFPVKLSYDPLDQVLLVQSSVPLPREQRRERVNRQRFLDASGQNAQGEGLYPRAATPLAIFSPNFFDLSAEVGQRNSAPDLVGQISLATSGELVGGVYNVTIGGVPENFPSAGQAVWRWYDTRPERAKNTLLPSVVELGDIFTSSGGLLSGSRGGRGVRLSNGAFDQSTNLTTTDIRGQLPAGYDVELYRNGVLLTFKRGDETLRYDFLEVPLLFGRNEFLLVFYGPQGRKYEESRVIVTDGSILGRGQFEYELAVQEFERPVFSFDNGRDQFGGQRAGRGEPRYSATAAFGLNDKIALDFAIVNGPRPGLTLNEPVERLTSYAVGLRGSIWESRIRLSAGSDGNGGSAIGAEVLRRVFGANVAFGHYEYLNGYRGERNVDTIGEGLIRETRLRLDRPFRIGKRAINQSLTLNRNEFEDNRSDVQADWTVNWGSSRANWSNSLRYQSNQTAGSLNYTAFNEIALNVAHSNRWTSRGGISFELSPDAGIQSASILTNYRFNERMDLSVAVDRAFGQSETTRLRADLRREFGAFSLAFRTEFADNPSDTYFGIVLSTSLINRRTTRMPLVMSRPNADSAAVAATLFHDLNGDGRRNPGEPAVPGAQVRIDRGPSYQTDKRGLGMMTGLPPLQAVDITADLSSVEDAALLPTTRGLELFLRPGQIARIDMPLQTSGDIEGEVKLRRANGDQSVAGVLVQAIDASGKIIGESRTEFDGYFSIAGLPARPYRIRISPEQLQRLGLKDPGDIASGISQTGEQIGKIRFLLERVSGNGAPVSATPAQGGQR
jgi:hypothetical protein